MENFTAGSVRPAGRLLRRSQVVSRQAVTTASLIIFTAFPGCGVPIDTDNFTDIAYDTYVSRIGTEHFDPKGASHISYRLEFATDSYDLWYGMRIAEPDYEALLSVTTDYLSNPQRAAWMAKPIDSVQTESSTSIYPPKNWPQMDARPPEWWTPNVDSSIRCTCWHLQCETGGKGWHWIYDRSIEQLWIWEWNYQHHRF